MDCFWEVLVWEFLYLWKSHIFFDFLLSFSWERTSLLGQTKVLPFLFFPSYPGVTLGFCPSVRSAPHGNLEGELNPITFRMTQWTTSIIVILWYHYTTHSVYKASGHLAYHTLIYISKNFKLFKKWKNLQKCSKCRPGFFLSLSVYHSFCLSVFIILSVFMCLSLFPFFPSSSFFLSLFLYHSFCLYVFIILWGTTGRARLKVYI